jgi:hypothetical protein
MNDPILAFVIPLGGRGPVDPGFGGGFGGWGGPVDPGYGRPIFHPGHPDHGLPSGPGHVSPPIHHPGHPDHGLPSSPGHPSQGLPISPGHPEQGLPPGTPVTINPPLPPPPGDLASQIVIAVYKPGVGWKAQSYPVAPDQGLPPSGAQPKGR